MGTDWEQILGTSGNGIEAAWEDAVHSATSQADLPELSAIIDEVDDHDSL